MGNSWEGMIIEQVLRGLDAKGIYYTPYHYRTKGGSEIDLVLEGPFGIIPIEIKYSSRLKKNSLKGVEQFCADHDLPIGIIINNEDKVNWYTDKIVGVPMSYTL
jgi:predicted AAA+ superfamily ATPase